MDGEVVKYGNPIDISWPPAWTARWWGRRGGFVGLWLFRRWTQMTKARLRSFSETAPLSFVRSFGQDPYGREALELTLRAADDGYEGRLSAVAGAVGDTGQYGFREFLMRLLLRRT